MLETFTDEENKLFYETILKEIAQRRKVIEHEKGKLQLEDNILHLAESTARLELQKLTDERKVN